MRDELPLSKDEILELLGNLCESSDCATCAPRRPELETALAAHDLRAQLAEGLKQWGCGKHEHEAAQCIQNGACPLCFDGLVAEVARLRGALERAVDIMSDHREGWPVCMSLAYGTIRDALATKPAKEEER